VLEEAEIPVVSNELDRALKTNKRRSRLASAGILALGLLALFLAIQFSPSKRRQRAAAALPPGADSAAVTAALGSRPTRCPAGSLDHLAGALPALSVERQDSALARLHRATRERWLYPGDKGCGGSPGGSEVGIDSAGRVLWVLPDQDHGTVRLAPGVSR
jgi:hypothetical protein